MNAQEKLDILSADSQYDLACACGSGAGDRRRRATDGASWLYPVPLSSGGHGVMLKTLMTNACSNDCRYCPLRGGTNARRCAVSPEEIVAAFMDYHRKRGLYGIFLSSGVPDTPDRAMENLIAAAELLRKKERYRGVVHLKIIPGASDAAILAALHYATTVSLNIEVPGAGHFRKLSAAKNFDADIVHQLKFISEQTARGMKYQRVKSTTQFVVGASDETDAEIVRYMDGIYHRLNFNRIYFSAYQQGLGDPAIPGERQVFSLQDGRDRLTREHRLYQADFLLRKYKFDASELIFEPDGKLALTVDPKQRWAQAHPEFFPVKVNLAPREALLRVPAVGPTYADRIVMLRRAAKLHSPGDIGLTGLNAAKAAAYLDFS
ncbi:MAG: radical SAM protein [Victivallaceae bacterium]|nr:radical SAM protein [Victivallaceae bacterium]